MTDLSESKWGSHLAPASVNLSYNCIQLYFWNQRLRLKTTEWGYPATVIYTVDVCLKWNRISIWANYKEFQVDENWADSQKCNKGFSLWLFLHFFLFFLNVPILSTKKLKVCPPAVMTWHDLCASPKSYMLNKACSLKCQHWEVLEPLRSRAQWEVILPGVRRRRDNLGHGTRFVSTEWDVRKC